MTASLLEQLADLPKAEVDALIRAMAPGEANAFEYDWRGAGLGRSSSNDACRSVLGKRADGVLATLASAFVTRLV